MRTVPRVHEEHPRPASSRSMPRGVDLVGNLVAQQVQAVELLLGYDSRDLHVEIVEEVLDRLRPDERSVVDGVERGHGSNLFQLVQPLTGRLAGETR
jgi:hypothetical protein